MYACIKLLHFCFEFGLILNTLVTNFYTNVFIIDTIRWVVSKYAKGSSLRINKKCSYGKENK